MSFTPKYIHLEGYVRDDWSCDGRWETQKMSWFLVLVIFFVAYHEYITFILILLIIIIIIIMSCRQHGYPWPSLATLPYHSSLLACPQGYIPYHHRATVCRFEQVALLLLGHVRGSIREHHLWAHHCFSSSVLHIWFVWLG